MPNHATPTAIRIAQGNPSGRPLPLNEPKAATGAPPMPLDLSPAAQMVWQELVPVLLSMGTLTTSDGDALAALCVQKALYQEAVEHYTRNGLVIQSSQGMKKNPAVTIADAALKQYRALLGEFGMTPASRTRIQADHPDLESPLSKLLNERQRIRGVMFEAE
jgi:P27 family predicted phage terminase small subunit